MRLPLSEWRIRLSAWASTAADSSAAAVGGRLRKLLDQMELELEESEAAASDAATVVEKDWHIG
jgi:hypothetical protein